MVKGQAEIEMLALNSKESFEQNKNLLSGAQGSEELPAIRRLLEQDSKHLDRIQVLMASSREFYIIIRLRSEKDTDVFPSLSRIEQSINDNGSPPAGPPSRISNGCWASTSSKNVTTEQYEDYDGDRWVIVGEGKSKAGRCSNGRDASTEKGGIHFGKESEKTGSGP